MYPGWQSTVTMMSVMFGPPLELLRIWWARLKWWVSLFRRIAALSPGQRAALVSGLAHLEANRPFTTIVRVPIVVKEQIPAPVTLPNRVVVKPSLARPWWRLAQRLERFSAAQRVVLWRVVTLMELPVWADAVAKVQRCATSPKFHQPEQWVAYSRAVKADAGQAQNIWRHVRVVQELQAAHDLTNPDAHFLAELAYQVTAATPRPATIVAHPVLHYRDGAA